MISSRLLNHLARFADCRSGNTAMLFALSAIPLFGAAGVALDYGHAHMAKSELQAAADAAVVSAAKAETDPTARSGIAKSVFASNVAGRAFISSSVPNVSVSGDGVSLTASAMVPTSFTRIFGYKNISIHAEASAAAGKDFGNGGAACVLALSETDDGALIYVSNRGLRHGPDEVMRRLALGEPVDPAEYYFRTTPVFETGAPEYTWLNGVVAVAAGERRADEVIITVYEVT